MDGLFSDEHFQKPLPRSAFFCLCKRNSCKKLQCVRNVSQMLQICIHYWLYIWAARPFLAQGEASGMNGDENLCASRTICDWFSLRGLSVTLSTGCLVKNVKNPQFTPKCSPDVSLVS